MTAIGMLVTVTTRCAARPSRYSSSWPWMWRAVGHVGPVGPVGHVDPVGLAVLAALDLRDHAAAEPRALLLSYLKDKELLLVIDNCEHLLPATAELVSEVIRAA